MSETNQSLMASRDRWKRRALLFREGYREEQFKATALYIQKIQLEALGTDATLIKQRDSLSAKLMEVVRERNALRAELNELKEKLTCSYLCPPHLEYCTRARGHKGDCVCERSLICRLKRLAERFGWWLSSEAER